MATTWVFPLAGQSNMVGRDDADGSSAWPDAVRFVTQEGGLIAPAAEIAAPEGNGGPYLIPKRFAAGLPRDPAAGQHRLRPRRGRRDELLEPPLEPGRRPLRQPRRADDGRPGPRIRPGACAPCCSRASRPTRRTRMLATTFRRALDRFVRAVRADLRAPELPIVFGELPAGFVDAPPRAHRHPRRAPPRALAAPLHRRRLEPVPERRRRRRPALLDRRPPQRSATASPPPSLTPRRTPSPRSSADRFRRMRRA